MYEKEIARCTSLQKYINIFKVINEDFVKEKHTVDSSKAILFSLVSKIKVEDNSVDSLRPYKAAFFWRMRSFKFIFLTKAILKQYKSSFSNNLAVRGAYTSLEFTRKTKGEQDRKYFRMVLYIYIVLILLKYSELYI